MSTAQSVPHLQDSISPPVKLVPSYRESETFFGRELSHSGPYVAVGNFAESAGPDNEAFLFRKGAVYLFERGAAGEWQEVHRLKPPFPTERGEFGRGVSLSGNRLLVGVREETTQQSHVDWGAWGMYLFAPDQEGKWKETAHFSPWTKPSWGDDTAPLLSVCLNKRYAFAGVSSNYEDGEGIIDYEGGSVYVFEEQADGQWIGTDQLIPPAPEQDAHFGASIAAAGDFVLVGAPDTRVEIAFRNVPAGQWSGLKPAPDSPYGAECGMAHLFQRTKQGKWKRVQDFQAPFPAPGALFGQSIALSDSCVVITAPNFEIEEGMQGTEAVDYSGRRKSNAELEAEEDLPFDGPNYFEVGVAFVYRRTPSGSWVLEQILEAPNLDEAGHFGQSVALYGDVLAVSATHETGYLADQGGKLVEYFGAVYLYRRLETNGNAKGSPPEKGKEEAPSGKGNEGSGSNIKNGSKDESGDQSPQTSSTENGPWVLVGKLLPPPGQRVFLGSGLAFSEKFLVAGASLDSFDSDGKNQKGQAGSVSIYSSESLLNSIHKENYIPIKD